MNPPSRLPPKATQLDGSALARTEELRQKIEEQIGPLVSGGQSRVQVIERVTQMMSAEIYKGPIPHPRHLQAYEDVCPGAADRLIKMAETAQARHEDRRDRLIECEYDDRKLGLFLGFAALLAVVGSGVFLVYIGQTVVGSGLLGAAVLGTVVGSFVHGRRPNDAKGIPNDAKEIPHDKKAIQKS